MIRIETDYPLRISTDQPVSIQTEGSVTTMTITGSRALDDQDEFHGLAPPRPEDPREALIPPPVTSRMKGPRCGKIMKRSGQPCARLEGHRGVCMTAKQIKNKQRYNNKAARQRYADDEQYREQVKAASRNSYARTHGTAE